jgi:hypothetical protein
MEVLKMSIVQTLTEGMVQRDMAKEGQALLNKWGQTGLLEGLSNDQQKHNMARLLENQAKELLRESSSMASGDVEGFAAVAFPIVRRVFAGLIANDLVSVQPMSLPSGLIFFMDFKFSDNSPAGVADRLGYEIGDSIYGGGKLASQITGGVNISRDRDLGGGPRGLNNGYASATGSVTVDLTALVLVASGTVNVAAGEGDNPLSAADQATLESLVQYDPDLAGRNVAVFEFTGSTAMSQFVVDNVTAISSSGGARGIHIRRCTRIGSGSLTQDPSSDLYRFTMVYAAPAGTVLDNGGATSLLGAISASDVSTSFPIDDDLVAGNGLGSIKGDDLWDLEGNERIPEIDIKVDSVAITAETKKLKAKWTPELGQDLNAYHNLDAEVELTSILSEQIALELDREIMTDLIVGATAGTYYWSRSPGLFVNRETGAEVGAAAKAPDFTGTVSEWYETLIETINDISAQIHRKTLRGGANFIVCGPEVANILEFTSGFRANVTADADKGDIGAVKVGSLSRKFDVVVDPYFPRTVILVGRKGSSFLESGYVYAPYVPLQTTPTIFGPEDFVPRKGVMTRYAKKMVRPDMYGLVIVRGLLGESGASS